MRVRVYGYTRALVRVSVRACLRAGGEKALTDAGGEGRRVASATTAAALDAGEAVTSAEEADVGTAATSDGKKRKR